MIRWKLVQMDLVGQVTFQVETWNGSSWTEVGDLSQARYNLKDLRNTNSRDSHFWWCRNRWIVYNRKYGNNRMVVHGSRLLDLRPRIEEVLVSGLLVVKR